MPAGKTLLVLLAPWITQVAAFAHIRSRPRTHGVRSVARRAAGDCDSPTSRRDLFTKAASLTALAFPNAALALAQITAPAPDQLKQYDLPRNALQDAAFAQGMASGMGSYERAACAAASCFFLSLALFLARVLSEHTAISRHPTRRFPTKQRLFERMFTKLQDTAEPTVVEIGIGSFPNAPYYTPRLKGRGGLDIIGVDPNDRMESYARDNAARAGLGSTSSLRVVHGVSEALPLASKSCDAVVCSLTLCSVVDPARSVAEIKRVLRPGGQFVFWEHVLSETDPSFAEEQVRATPMQIKRADGCHLDRRTGDIIRKAGFRSCDLEYLELKGFGFLNPTVCGIATA